MADLPLHNLVICVGTTGDVHPFSRITKALQVIGRDMTFITQTFHTRVLEPGCHSSGLAARSQNKTTAWYGSSKTSAWLSESTS